MSDEIIGMADMTAIFQVTDGFGIDRESISVPLEKQGMGSVERGAGGSLEITAPSEVSTADWLPTLRGELERLGFAVQQDEEEAWS
jgi:hypothetical protein